MGRPDAARFFPPGTDPADINPTLPRKPDAAKEAAFEAELAAEVAKGYRLLAVLREEVAEIRAERKRRLEEAKYSPSQPRVPAGNPRGGQWTDRSGGQGTVVNPSQDTGQETGTSLAQPMGNVDIGDISGSSELGDLFQIKPRDTRVDGVQLAANDSPDDPAPLRDPAPKIPLSRPDTSAERTNYMRAAANWLARNAGLAGAIYSGNMNNIEWLKDRQDLIAAYRDEPKTLEELQRAVQEPKPGYDIHHIAEQTAAERFGFTRSQVNDPENLVRVPRLKHYEITGWYMDRNVDFGNLSPRDYLSDKSWEERRRVGLDALVRFKVLKP
ncbi:MAG: hypothetical protein QOJ86_434 [Bradyrhizobium sp.]|nr:hypothetical protein [Bradyrhizobium sp.]